MIRKFTFSENNLESFILHAHQLLPGIERMIAVYFDDHADMLKAKMLSNSGNERRIESLNLEESRDVIGSFRINKTRFNWYNRDDLPFLLEKKSKRETSIFSELDNVVLLLRFKNESDELNDLLFIYFNKNFGSFGLSHADKALSTDNKQIIVTLLYNSFQAQIQQNKQNRGILQNIKTHTNALMGEMEQLQKELQRTRSDYGESLVNLCLEYLKDFSQENGREYLLNDEARNKVRTFKGNIKYLYPIIRDSVVFAENMYMGHGDDEILIKDHHINLESYDTETVEQESGNGRMEKYRKTILLLDKLENAARTVLGKRQSLTSGNVGEACPTPISAPAITDALKKHKTKILNLFARYPDKWEVIRREFRPVRNLMLKADQAKFRTA